MNSFRKELVELVNLHNLENGSNTPDWILANFILASIDAFDEGVARRERWYGRERDDETDSVVALGG